MHAIATIGLDIAKSVFQVHAYDVNGKVIMRRLEAALCNSVFPEAATVPC